MKKGAVLAYQRVTSDTALPAWLPKATWGTPRGGGSTFGIHRKGGGGGKSESECVLHETTWTALTGKGL